MSTVLLTGGAGFIGSHLLDRLLQLNYDVTVVDNLSSGKMQFLPQEYSLNNKLYIEDFSSERILEQVKNDKFDYIVHLAALPRVSFSVEFPFETQLVNSCKTVKLLSAARHHCKRFIFASSSSVYGGAHVLPTPEHYLKQPKSPYALQKHHIEEYLQMFGSLYNFDSIALRFFNVFGERQLGNSPYATAISSWMTAIKNNTLLRFDGDGTQSRDMSHVKNVIHAIVLAIQSNSRFNGNQFNVGCGINVTNNSILENLLKKYSNANIEFAPVRAGDVKHTCADISSIQKSLNYTPVKQFWDGLEDTITWYENNWHWFGKL